MTPALLWDDNPPARPGHATQQAAADFVAPFVPSMRERVYAYIAAQDNGATNDEISRALGMRIQTVCGRCNELQHEGRIANLMQETRRTSSGAMAKVWRAMK